MARKRRVGEKTRQPGGAAQSLAQKLSAPLSAVRRDKKSSSTVKHRRQRQRPPPPTKPPPHRSSTTITDDGKNDGSAEDTSSQSIVGSKRTATTAPPEKRIDKETINALPLTAWEGPVEIVQHRKDMQRIVQKLLNHGKDCVLGFDTETRPVFRKGDYQPPALVQLANEECVYLFQILHGDGGGGLDVLVPLLEATHVLKVGVAVQGDIKALQKVHPFRPGGFVELSERTQKLGYVNTGLRALAALLLGKRISKKAQMSNWAKPTLDEHQIAYAATDAWIGRELYLRVREQEEAAAVVMPK